MKQGKYTELINTRLEYIIRRKYDGARFGPKW
jgi:hypothetical protein